MQGLHVSGRHYAWGETVASANGNRVRIDCTFDAPGARKASKEGKLTVRSSDPRPDVTIPLRLAMRPLYAPLPSLCAVRARLRVL